MCVSNIGREFLTLSRHVEKKTGRGAKKRSFARKQNK